MTQLTLRKTKGKPLSHTELDNNFSYLDSKTGGGGSAALQSNTVFVDAALGEDTTASATDPTKPYATLDQAITANGGNMNYSIVGDAVLDIASLAILVNATVSCSGTLTISGAEAQAMVAGQRNLTIKAKNIVWHSGGYRQPGGTDIGGIFNFIAEEQIFFDQDNRTDFLFQLADATADLFITFKATEIISTGAPDTSNTRYLFKIGTNTAVDYNFFITIDADVQYWNHRCPIINAYDNCEFLLKGKHIKFHPKYNGPSFRNNKNGKITIEADIVSIKGDTHLGARDQSIYTGISGFFSCDSGGLNTIDVRLFEAINSTSTVNPIPVFHSGIGGCFILKGMYNLKGYSLFSAASFSSLYLDNTTVYIQDGVVTTVPHVLAAKGLLTASFKNAVFHHANAAVPFMVTHTAANPVTNTDVDFKVYTAYTNADTTVLGTGAQSVGAIVQDSSVAPLGNTESSFSNWILN